MASSSAFIVVASVVLGAVVLDASPPSTEIAEGAFTPEHKAKAVPLIQVGERSICEDAKALDLTKTALREWTRAHGGERPRANPAAL